MRKVYSLLISSLMPIACASTNLPKQAHSGPERARLLLDQWVSSSESPGIQYTVVFKDGQRFDYSAGLADIKRKIPTSISTTWMAYSMTKTFTAAALLLLVQDGKLDLDSPVIKYLPEFPYGDKVNLRHLLAQTSGLPNPIPLRWVHLVGEHARFSERAALASITRANKELDFEPGEKYAYSNLSYWYLGEVIAHVSGLPYSQFLRQKLLNPLGISDAEAAFEIPNPEFHAKGYLRKWSFMNLLKGFVTDRKFWGEYEDGWLEILPHYIDGPAFGGLICNAQGVAKFLQDQLRDSSLVFKPALRQAFFTRQVDNGGRPVETTLGWHTGVLNGIEYFYKEGGGAGFHLEMRVYPSMEMASVILTNSTTFNTRKNLSECDVSFFSATNRARTL